MQRSSLVPRPSHVSHATLKNMGRPGNEATAFFQNVSDKTGCVSVIISQDTMHGPQMLGKVNNMLSTEMRP